MNGSFKKSGPAIAAAFRSLPKFHQQDKAIR
jgi:hypothetical protein